MTGTPISSVLEEPVHFDLDVNIDGVKLFENSMMASADPILARVHAINGVRIPIMRAKPFVVGVYHGPGNFIRLNLFTAIFCNYYM